jgi:hypothetical protein
MELHRDSLCGGETHLLLGTECCGGGVVAGEDTKVGGALVSRECYTLGVECNSCTDHRYTFLYLMIPL